VANGVITHTCSMYRLTELLKTLWIQLSLHGRPFCRTYCVFSVKYSQQSTFTAAVSCDGGISVLNHCLTWSKFVNNHLSHSSQWFNIHLAFAERVTCALRDTLPSLDCLLITVVVAVAAFRQLRDRCGVVANAT